MWELSKEGIYDYKVLEELYKVQQERVEEKGLSFSEQLKTGFSQIYAFNQIKINWV